MSKHIPQHAHGHGHSDATGKGHNDTAYADPKAGVSQIGKHFTPMVGTAPVASLSVKHHKIQCAACTAKTWHAAGQPVPPCAYCGDPLSVELAV